MFVFCEAFCCWVVRAVIRVLAVATRFALVRFEVVAVVVDAAGLVVEEVLVGDVVELGLVEGAAGAVVVLGAVVVVGAVVVDGATAAGGPLGIGEVEAAAAGHGLGAVIELCTDLR